MADLLVRLYDLPPARAVDPPALVRRALACDMRAVTRWVEARFGAGWAGECEVAFANRPLACHLATWEGELAGFACWDATAKGLFGPVGVDERFRGRGLGRALLLDCLGAMAADGYAYAVIGWAHDAAFYARAAGATEIPGSEPGLYRHRLREATP